MFREKEWNDDQRVRWISTIRSNCLKSMHQLLAFTGGLENWETRSPLEAKITSMNSMNVNSGGSGEDRPFVVEERNVDGAKSVLWKSPMAEDWSRELASHLRHLWFDSHIQHAFEKYGHLLPDENVEYNFSTNLCEQVCNPSFVPSDTDIVMNARKTVGLQDDTFDLSANLSVTFWDTGGQRSERRVCVCAHVLYEIYIACTCDIDFDCVMCHLSCVIRLC